MSAPFGGTSSTCEDCHSSSRCAKAADVAQAIAAASTRIVRNLFIGCPLQFGRRRSATATSSPTSPIGLATTGHLVGRCTVGQSLALMNRGILPAWVAVLQTTDADL